jgi:hypothetical protein
MGYKLEELPSSVMKCSDSSCNPKLQPYAAAKLKKATEEKGKFITVNSAWRSSAQQFFLYIRVKAGTNSCPEVTSAAPPGRSDHEGGNAIDFNQSNKADWETALTNNGFNNLYAMHFELKNPILNKPSENLRAFQKLWNLNNPGAQLDEDGIFGRLTFFAFCLAPA